MMKLSERSVKIKELISGQVDMGTFGLVELELIEFDKELSELKKLRVGDVMPRRLTAENGAKALLMGEFFEYHEISYYDEDGDEVERLEKVPVSWNTIKKIYDKIVSHYGA